MIFYCYPPLWGIFLIFIYMDLFIFSESDIEQIKRNASQYFLEGGIRDPLAEAYIKAICEALSDKGLLKCDIIKIENHSDNLD